jgi:hypothetical protein
MQDILRCSGLEQLPEDLEAFDDNDENHQYNLVFNAWDAQFDEDWRKWRNFEPADQSTIATFEAALAPANSISDELQTKFSDEAKYREWAEACKRNLSSWAGDGIRTRQ